MRLSSWLLALGLFAAPVSAMAAPVLMISIDGLRPGDVLEADKRGIAVPTLRSFVTAGAYATGVRNSLPTVTYPNHTTLITGVWPARHGIANNLTFDPLNKNAAGWYWYAQDIKVTTLWDAVHRAGRPVASLGWPVSVGAPSIDANLPEYWRAGTPDDLKLLRALASPGLVDEIARDAKVSLEGIESEDPSGDVVKAHYAAAMIKAKPPAFMTIHLSSLDHIQHVHGPDTPEAHAALQQIDQDVHEIVDAARAAHPDTVVAIVSDHGFAKLTTEVNLKVPFIAAGLMTYDTDKHRVTAWDAAPWGAAGSAAVVLAHPDDAALRAKVAGLLADLAHRPDLGIAGVIDQAEVAKRGGTPLASFFVNFKLGYEMGNANAGSLLQPSELKGMHGYFPDAPEMHATFIVAGPGVKRGPLGEIDMRDIAPTLAKLMDVTLPEADGKPLF